MIALDASTTLRWLFVDEATPTSDAVFGEAHNLSVYDAAYLELAMRRGLPLASCDRQLVAAAERLGLEVLTA